MHKILSTKTNTCLSHPRTMEQYYTEFPDNYLITNESNYPEKYVEFVPEYE